MDWLTKNFQKEIHFLCQNKIHIVVLFKDIKRIEELDQKENTLFLSEWSMYSKHDYPKYAKFIVWPQTYEDFKRKERK